jgi:hypothetical protein
VVGFGEINHFKHEHLSAIIAGVPKSDRQGDPSKGNILLTWDHSAEWVWATLEMVLGEP